MRARSHVLRRRGVVALAALLACGTTAAAAERRAPSGAPLLPALAAGAVLEVEADRVEVTPERILATGNVVIRRGDLVLKADEIDVPVTDGEAVVVKARVSVEAPGSCRPLAEGARMRVAADGSVEVEGAVAFPCACKPGALLRVTAPRLRLTPGGRRIILHRPALRLGRVPVFWLPYLSVPADGRGSGMLPPHLAFGARDGLAVGVGAFFELTPWADLTTRIDLRTHRGLAPSVRARLSGSSVDLLVLRDWSLDSWRGALTARVDERPLPGLTVGGRAVLASDDALAEDLGYSLADRTVRTHDVELLLRWAGNPAGIPLRWHLGLDARDDLSRPGGLLRLPAHLPFASIQIGPVPVRAPGRLGVLLLHGDVGAAQLVRTDLDGSLLDRLRVHGRVGGVWPFALSALRVTIGSEGMAVIHAGAAGPDGIARETGALLRLLGSVELSLPLGRRYRLGHTGRSLRHELWPSVRVIGAGMLRLGEPAAVLDPGASGVVDLLDRLGAGLAAAVGLTQRYLYSPAVPDGVDRWERSLLRTDLALAVDFRREPVLLGSLAIGGERGPGLRAALAHPLNDLRPSEARFELTFVDPLRRYFAARWIRVVAEHAGRLFLDDPGSPLFVGSLLPPTHIADLSEVQLEVRVPFGPVTAGGQVRLDLVEAGDRPVRDAFVAASVGATYLARCGCLRASVVLSWVSGQVVPDVLGTLMLRPPAWRR